MRNSTTAIVIGGGLAGITTAYELASRGYRTMLLEARDGVALETSHANGAMLTPSMSDPWNAPGVHRRLLASFFDSHSAMKLRLSALPSLAGWGLRFLRNSNAAQYAAATRASFVLAKYSVDCTRELRAKLGFCYDASDRGTLKIFRDAHAMAGPLALAEMLQPLGLRFQALDREAAVAAEPALAEIRPQIHGALRFPDDESGDALKFCQALTSSFERAGGVLKKRTHVRALRIVSGGVRGIELTDSVLEAETVIVAAGAATAAIMRDAGMRLPIRPVKGYTVTFPMAPGGPTIPVIDDALHAAVVPLGARLRVAGTAEFTGSDLRIRKERIENLLALLRAIYPRLGARLDPASGLCWAGLRPMSADGLPFIGATPVQGLYVNAGHGHLGWTLAAGSARLLADLIDGRPAAIDSAPYRTTR